MVQKLISEVQPHAEGHRSAVAAIVKINGCVPVSSCAALLVYRSLYNSYFSTFENFAKFLRP
jgi:hypothetical protein